jgi:hypothetical protein
MIKLRSKRFCRSISKLTGGNNIKVAEKGCGGISEIKWELRPGGMLVQKRDSGESEGEGMITIRVSTVSKWHDISIEATSTFGKSSHIQFATNTRSFILDWLKELKLMILLVEVVSYDLYNINFTCYNH